MRGVAAATLAVGLGALGAAGAADASVPTSYPNVVFSDGFDSGSLSAWNGAQGSGTAAVTPAAAYTGVDGLRLTNAPGQYELAVKALSAPLTDSSTSFWVRVNSAASGFSGTNMEDIAEARDKASSADVWQLIYDAQQHGLWFLPSQGATEQAIFTGAGTVPLGTWTHVEVRYDATSTGGAEILINGQTQPGWTLSGNYTRSDNLQRIQLWNDAANTTDFDDVVVAAPAALSAGTATSAPSSTTVPVVSGQTVQGNTVKSSEGSWSGSPTSYAYKWKDCNSYGASCTAIKGATSSSYALVAKDVGHAVVSVVTATNSSGSASATSAPTPAVTAASSAPSNTALPTISGSTVQGSTLTTSNGSWSGSPTSYVHKWEDCDSSGANCTAISGATSSTYTLAAGDAGHTIRSVVTATNAVGSASATSTQTASVTGTTPTAPSDTALPTISGTAQQGATLTASPGTWAGTTPMSYSYLWSDGTIGQTDTLPASDVGKTVSVTVTASNSAGSATATSAQTGTVTASSGSGTGTGHFQSVVFWLAYDGGTLSSLPWNGVTQVDLMSLATCVSAGNPDPDCSGPTSIDTEFNGVSNVSSFVNAVHAGGGQAIITIGGSTNPNWYYPCNGSNAAAFAQNLVNYMQSNGFDGVDLDIEQDTPTGSPQFTAADLQACAADVYNDAKAIKTQAGKTPIVTSDVDPTTDYDIGQIEQPYVDQFNAMSYNATGSTLASQIHELETQSGIPASKITEGVDIDDYPSTKSDCGPNASWASSNGLAGAMLWIGQDDAPTYTCLNAVAPYVH